MLNKETIEIKYKKKIMFDQMLKFIYNGKLKTQNELFMNGTYNLQDRNKQE